MVIGIDASRAFVVDRTGTENYSYQVIKQMLKLSQAREHSFILFVRPGSGWKSEKFLQRRNIDIVEIRLMWLWTQVGLAFETWRRGLDVLFVPAHTLPILRKPGLKTVVTIHGLEYQWLPEYKNWLQRWYLPLSTRYAVRSATKLIAVSEFTKTQLIELLGARPDRIKVIYEGVEKKLFEKRVSRRLIQAVHGKFGIRIPFILFVGTLQPRKNLGFLIKVYMRLREKEKGLQLVLAGSKGWLVDEVLRMPRDLGVEDDVIFTGRVDDDELIALLQSARVYVQPSITEGFGLPVLEAMAARTAVVTSDGGALPEVVGMAGVVIRGFKLKTWVAKLGRVVGDERYRRGLVQSGRERISRFTWDKSAKDCFEVLVK